MKLKSLTSFSFLLCLSAYACAQNICTVSYVPVKNGYYEKIVTKSKASFASEKDSAVFGDVKTNDEYLGITTDSLTFGKPVYVRDNILSEGVIHVTGNLYADGTVIVDGTVSADAASGVNILKATNVMMPKTKVNLGGGSFYVGGIGIQAPSCKVGWKSVSAYDTGGTLSTHYLLACVGAASSCQNPASAKPDGSCCSGYRPYNSSKGKCCGTPSYTDLDSNFFSGTFANMQAAMGDMLCPVANYGCSGSDTGSCIAYTAGTKEGLQRSAWVSAASNTYDTCDGDVTHTYSGTCKTCVDVAGVAPSGTYKGTVNTYTLTSPNGSTPGWVCPDPKGSGIPYIGLAVYNANISASTDGRACESLCFGSTACYFYSYKQTPSGNQSSGNASCRVDIAILSCPARFAQKSNVSCGNVAGFYLKRLNCCP